MKLHFTIFLFAISTIVSAQFKFEKGYFISNAGTRTNCYIKDVNWNSNPKTFEYKAQEESELKEQGISAVSEFGIDNIVTFKRFKVMIDRSTDEIRKLGKSNKPDFHEEELFLKLLVPGKVNLYMYRDGGITRFFYETEKVPLEQLIYLRYIVASGDMATNNYFRQQLLQNVSNSYTSQKDLKNMKYRESDLTKYFLKYNDKKEQKPVKKEAVKANIKEIIALRIAPGFFQSTASIGIPAENFYSGSQVSFGKATLSIGAEIEFYLNKKKSFGLFLNPAYHTFKGDETYTQSRTFFPEQMHQIGLSYKSFEIASGIRYGFFTNKNSKVFTNLGISYDLSADVTIHRDGKFLPLKSQTSAGILIGVGYSYKKYSLEFRYISKKSIVESSNTSFSAKYQRAGIVLGYNFL